MRVAISAAALICLPCLASAEPYGDGIRWTNSGDYTAYQTRGTTKAPAPTYNWASPQAYRDPSVGGNSKVLRGIGRAGKLVYDDFSLIADAERANVKSRAFLNSAGKIIGGSVAGGGKWGNALSRASKYLRPVGRAINWLGWGATGYALWNLAFGDGGDVVSPANSVNEIASDDLAVPTTTAGFLAAPMMLSSRLQKGFAYPSFDPVDSFGVASVVGRPFLTVGEISGGFAMALILYTPVPPATPLKSSGSCSYGPWSSGVFVGRVLPSSCYDVVAKENGRFRVDSILIDEWPGRSTSFSCVGVKSPTQGWLTNPRRCVYKGDTTSFEAVPWKVSPAIGPGRPGEPNDEQKSLPLNPDALKHIIKQALREAGLSADEATVDRYSAEAVRDATGAELAREVLEDEALATGPQRAAGPLYAYMPQVVVDSQIGEDNGEPGTGEPGTGNPGTPGSINLNQTVETDDDDPSSPVPLININPFAVEGEPCPRWAFPVNGTTYYLDPGCTYWEQYSGFIRPIIFSSICFMGFSMFRRS